MSQYWRGRGTEHTRILTHCASSSSFNLLHSVSLVCYHFICPPLPLILFCGLRSLKIAPYVFSGHNQRCSGTIDARHRHTRASLTLPRETKQHSKTHTTKDSILLLHSQILLQLEISAITWRKWVKKSPKSYYKQKYTNNKQNIRVDWYGIGCSDASLHCPYSGSEATRQTIYRHVSLTFTWFLWSVTRLAD